MRLNKLLILALVLFPSLSWGATYYIDHSGGADTNNGTSTVTAFAHAPGMSGCANTCESTTLVAGDTVIFKGGETWTLHGTDTDMLTISASGSDGGGSILYQGGQRLGTLWGTGYPVFNGGGVNSANGIYSNGKTHITIDGIKIYNVGYEPDGSGTGIVFYDGSHIEVKNCLLDTNAITGFHYGVNGSGNSTHAIYFHDNLVANTGRVTIQVDNNTVDDVRLYNNLMSGLGTYGPHSYHGDGFMIGGDRTTTAYAITNLLIYGNKFYGDWTSGATAAIYLNGSTGTYSVNGAKVYNNIIAFENNTCSSPSYSPGAIAVYTPGYHANIEIYNNTVSMDACTSTPVSTCIFFSCTGACNNITVKNNIVSGCDNGIAYENCTGAITIDSNLFYTVGGNHLVYDVTGSNRYDTCVAAQAAGFGTTFCEIGDPLYVALPSGGVTGSGNWDLQSSSPARGHSQDMSGTFTDDYAKRTRSTWDIGAYEYAAAGGDTTSPLITAFVIPATNEGYVVPITTFTCTDETALHATPYCIVETDSSFGCSWSATAPANHTYITQGSKTLYAFCRDAATNISLSSNDSVTVTIHHLLWKRQ